MTQPGGGGSVNDAALLPASEKETEAKGGTLQSPELTTRDDPPAGCPIVGDSAHPCSRSRSHYHDYL